MVECVSLEGGGWGGRGDTKVCTHVLRRFHTLGPTFSCEQTEAISMGMLVNMGTHS